MTEAQSGIELESYENNSIEMTLIDSTEMPIGIISQSHQFCSKLGKFRITDGRFAPSSLSNGVAEMVGCSSSLLASSTSYGSFPSSTDGDMVARYSWMIGGAPTLNTRFIPKHVVKYRYHIVTRVAVSTHVPPPLQRIPFSYCTVLYEVS